MNWRLTRDALGEPEVEYRTPQNDEDLTLGYSLLRELARSDATLVEVAPGVWRHSKLDDAREW